MNACRRSTLGKNPKISPKNIIEIPPRVTYCVGAFLLFLFAMQVEHRKVDVVEKFGVVLHTSATGEENDNFLLEIALKERKQEQKSFV